MTKKKTDAVEEVSDEENERRYNEFFEWLRNKPVPKFVEWWDVENTGWSGGTSWFSTGGTPANPLRFDTEQAAKDYAIAKKADLNDPTTKWRYMHTTLEREGNKSVTTTEWTEV